MVTTEHTTALYLLTFRQSVDELNHARCEVKLNIYQNSYTKFDQEYFTIMLDALLYGQNKIRICYVTLLNDFEPFIVHRRKHLK